MRGSTLAHLPCVYNAYLFIEHGRIAAYGSMQHLPEFLQNFTGEKVDATGKIIMPCWVDSHTHIVFAGTRENEFVDKIKGLSYAEIAQKGGGILNSAKHLLVTSEEELYNSAKKRIEALIKLGTGAIEIKSGYGLSTEGELKMLRVIKRLKQTCSIPVKATFLGAHAFPPAFQHDHAAYIKLITSEMLPQIAADGLADFIDVFCEQGFFSADEMQVICEAGAAYGLQPKLHVNQLNSIGGIETGIQLQALSLDHLETLTPQEIQLLGQYKGVSTLLPTAAFFLRMPFQPARQLIAAGAAIAIASDYNPGSSPGGNMNFLASLSCIQMKMLPEEVINAGTTNAAFAIGLQDEVGSITVGKLANIFITEEVPSLNFLFYSFSTTHIERVMIAGIWQ